MWLKQNFLEVRYGKYIKDLWRNKLKSPVGGFFKNQIDFSLSGNLGAQFTKGVEIHVLLHQLFLVV